VVKEVWPYLTGGAALTVVMVLAAPPFAAVVMAALTAAVASFFRDPRRDVPADPRLILSPADGRVVGIEREREGTAGETRRVSIFLSVFNVHVNRSPVEGIVADIRYSPGAFLPAFREKASALNEQNLISLDTQRGPMAVKQIAGLIARRIRCWKRPGDRVAQGEKIGFITFGSRVDLFLPPEAEMRVSVGDRVKGGTSVVAVYPDQGRRA
jgi:phosphatidylserine decarboxylase